jgi:hypothetical protein
MFLRRVACSCFLVVVAALVGSAEEPAPDLELARAEQVLAEAHLPTDGPGLLHFLQERTLSEEQIERLAATIELLGDDDFQVRCQASQKLIAAGPAAVPFLRAALKDPDLEISQRARRCLQKIQQRSTASMMMAVARVLAERRPPGVVAALLAHLPCLDSALVEECWLAALARIGVHDDNADPALLAALTDRRPIRRAAAAHVLGHAPSVALRRQVLALLADDSVRVRFEAASALVCVGERRAVLPLIQLLAEAPAELAYQVELLLFELAQDHGPGVSLAEKPAPECRQRWLAWWQAHADEVDLARLGRIPPLRGLTLVCEYDSSPGQGGRVWEYGPDGKKRWEVGSLLGANDVQLLPGGRILVAERYASRVSERDLSGKVLWEHRTGGSAIACQRLANGNTLVATFTRLCEVTPGHKEVLVYTHPAGFRACRKLPSGHILCVTSQGELIELDAEAKKVRTIKPSAHAGGATYWASVEPLPGDRFLLTLGGAGRVVEIDSSGKVLWECTLPSPVHATRLRNGHTLVCCFENRCLIEVDQQGKEVSKQTLPGRPFKVCRY